MTIKVNTPTDSYLWIPVCKGNEKKKPRAFLPKESLNAKYTWGYKADPINSNYLDALIGVQTAFINDEKKMFPVKGGKKQELQKKYKWRHDNKESAPLLSPSLGWVKVPKSELLKLSSEDLADLLIDSGTDFVEYRGVTTILDPVLCRSEQELNEKVSELRSKVTNAYPLGQRLPDSIESNTTTYVRDAAVVAWVLYNAESYCECCLKDAPFNKLNGEPFLEVHHVKHLADRGSDTVENAIAVCPNCHRELHHGVNRYSIVDILYSRIGRLVRE